MGKHHPAAFGGVVELVTTLDCQSRGREFDPRRSRMKWLRYKVHWAWGTTDWEYVPLYTNKLDEETKEFVKNKVKDVNDNHSWSDKYRRVEYEVINSRQVPNAKIEKAYQDLAEQIAYWTEAAENGRDQLFLLEKLKGAGRKTDPDEIEKAKRKKKIDKVLKRKTPA